MSRASAVRERVIKNFDPKRIVWGGSSSQLNETIGIDPEHSAFVVRHHVCATKRVGTDIGDVGASMTLGEQIAATMAELRRLKAAKTGITVLPHFYTRVQPTEDGWEETHQYALRLAGEELTPDNPDHLKHLIRVGGAILSYLEGTPVGGQFAEEFCSITQYTAGLPWIRIDKRPLDTYIHDVEPQQDMNIRERPGEPASLIDRPSFADTVCTVGNDIGIIYDLHPSKETEELAARAAELQAAAL